MAIATHLEVRVQFASISGAITDSATRLDAGWANSFDLYNPSFGELRCMLGMYL